MLSLSSFSFSRGALNMPLTETWLWLFVVDPFVVEVVRSVAEDSWKWKRLMKMLELTKTIVEPRA
jgi:hypothetical protein